METTQQSPALSPVLRPTDRVVLLLVSAISNKKQCKRVKTVVKESKDNKAVGTNINAFHYYRLNVFVVSLKLKIGIFHAGFLPWSDFLFL